MDIPGEPRSVAMVVNVDELELLLEDFKRKRRRWSIQFFNDCVKFPKRDFHKWQRKKFQIDFFKRNANFFICGMKYHYGWFGYFGSIRPKLQIKAHVHCLNLELDHEHNYAEYVQMFQSTYVK